MDYARIYREFIADRLEKQPESPSYFERHHILPRSLSGGDEPENIIRLTPEDHLFAHLLLAKIHGGKLWAAVFLMGGVRGGKERPARQIRSAYGLARRAWSEVERGKDGLKGSDNGNYNSQVFKWKNMDTGKREEATLHDMWLKYGGVRSTWTSAIAEDSKKPSAFGWALDDGKRRTRSVKGQSFLFVNADGRDFQGTQKEFCDMAGLGYQAGTRVVKHAGVTACGWRLSTTKPRSCFASKKTGKPTQLGSGKVYAVHKNGETFRGTRSEVAKKLGCTAAQFSAACGHIAKGIASHYKGWRVQWQERLL